MNILNRMAGAFGLEVKGLQAIVDSDFFVRAMTLTEALAAVRGQAQLGDAYQAQVTVYSAIYACAINISQVPFRFYQGDDLTAGLQKTSPYDDIFERPNPMMSKFQLWEATEIFLKLRGECIWVLEFNGQRPDGNIPVEIYPQDPARFRPIVDPQTKGIAAWEYREDNGDKLYFENGTEIVQFKKYNPYDRLRGLSPLQAAAMSIRMGDSARTYNDAVLRNMGEPGGVLATDQPLSKEVADDIRDSFESRHQGPNRAKRLAVLHSGLKYQQTSLSQKDLEFLSSIKLSNEDILGALRVPKTEVFLYEDVRKETAEVQDRALWTKNLLPEMRYIEDTLWAQFFRVRGDKKTYGRFDESQIPALQDNLETKARTAKEYFSMGYPLNKINEHFGLGMEDVPWGDMGYLPFNLVPADQVGQTPEPAPAAALPPGFPPKQLPGRPGRIIYPVTLPVKPPAAIEDKGAVAFRRQVAQRFQMHMRPLEDRFTRRLRRLFFEVRQDVLNSFLRESRDAQIIDHMALIVSRAKKQLQTIAQPYIQDAIEAGGERLADFGITFNAADPLVRELLQHRTGKIKGIYDTVEDQLRRQLETGYAEHETLTQLADRLRDVFNFASSRATTIARTELSNASNQAFVIGEKQNGVERHQWATAGDELVRNSHAAQDGDIVDVGEPFANGLLFPGDPAGPPEEVINCRCCPVPIIGEGD